MTYKEVMTLVRAEEQFIEELQMDHVPLADWESWLATSQPGLLRASEWQWLFARRVLPLAGVRPEWITPEYPFSDSTGRSRRIDFAIRTPLKRHLALEVDGYDKTGRGSGMTQVEFADFLARQNSLTTQGWLVLRFANTAVRDDPEGCADAIRSALGPEATARAKVPTMLGDPCEKCGTQLVPLEEIVRRHEAQEPQEPAGPDWCGTGRIMWQMERRHPTCPNCYFARGWGAINDRDRIDDLPPERPSGDDPWA